MENIILPKTLGPKRLGYYSVKADIIQYLESLDFHKVKNIKSAGDYKDFGDELVIKTGYHRVLCLLFKDTGEVYIDSDRFPLQTYNISETKDIIFEDIWMN